MKGLLGASVTGLGMWCFGFGIFFSSPLLIVLCAVFLSAGGWILFGTPVPEEDRDDDEIL